MSEINDGGPAFPGLGQTSTRFPGVACEVVEFHEAGMSLRAYAAIQLRVPASGIDWLDDMIRQAQRDHFAGQALAGIAAHPVGANKKGLETNHEADARWADGRADAMLAARKGGAS